MGNEIDITQVVLSYGLYEVSIAFIFRLSLLSLFYFIDILV